MSEAMTMSVEPPPPSPEQLADWQGLVERIRQGDRSEVVAWDEVAAARSLGTYQVLVTQRVHQRLRGAPPLVAGSVAGIVAVLRVDPIEPSQLRTTAQTLACSEPPAAAKRCPAYLGAIPHSRD